MKKKKHLLRKRRSGKKVCGKIGDKSENGQQPYSGSVNNYDKEFKARVKKRLISLGADKEEHQDPRESE